MPRLLGAGPFFLTTGLLCLAAGLLAVASPPPVRQTDTPPALFSASRAEADIAALSALGPRPLRPLGQPSLPSHDRARDLLVERMRQLGLTPRLQRGEVYTEDGVLWQVENILGRLEPPTSTAAAGAVVLLSHYDSVAKSPGAGDAAAGVAAVLEIARALAATAALRHPLLVVIDDGEELGLLGAQLFLRHPWAKEAAVVLNFEARGTRGETAMFETSDRSAWLVEIYGQTVARPTTSSVIYSLYRMLPNDTDLTVTKSAGLYGLNFAFADADWNYHTARDDLSHLDLRSVQHMGDQGLAVARALVERPEALPCRPPADEDAVWFELFTAKLLVYRTKVAYGMAAGLLVAYLAALGLLVRRGGGRALGHGLGRGVATLLVVLATGGLLSRAMAWLAGAAQPCREAPPLPAFCALIAAGVAAGSGASVLWDWRRQKARTAPAKDTVLGHALGALLPSVVAALLGTFYEVGASYPFALPALATAVPVLLALARRAQPADLRGPADAWMWAALLPGLLCAALVWFPLLRVVRVMVGIQVPLAIALPVALCLGFYEPLARLFAPGWRLLVVGQAAICAAFAVAIAVRG